MARTSSFCAIESGETREILEVGSSPANRHLSFILGYLQPLYMSYRSRPKADNLGIGITLVILAGALGVVYTKIMGIPIGF